MRLLYATLLAASFLFSGTEAMAQFVDGKFYRITSQRNRTLAENASKKATTITSNKSDMAAVWRAEKSEKGFVLRNAKSGRALQSVDANETPLPLGLSGTPLYTRSSTKYSNNYHLSWKSDFSGQDCVHEASDYRVVRWSAGDADRYSNWKIEEATDVNAQQIRDNIAKLYSNYVTTPVAGKTYRLVNAAYDNRALTANIYAKSITALPNDAKNLSQVWVLEGSGSNWALRTVLGDSYISASAGLSQAFTLNTSSTGKPLSTFYFNFSVGSELIPSVAIKGSGEYLHAGKNQNYSIVSWYNDQPASRWYLMPVDVNEADLAAARAELAANQELSASASSINLKLKKFFSDNACTQLLPQYKTMTDEQFVKAMNDLALPAVLQTMALRVKSDTWNSQNADANRLEKSFRIADYNVYSHHSKWTETSLVGAGFAFSRLNAPTGITIDAGKSAYIFVDKAPMAGTELKAELVTGFSPTGAQFPLKPGFNLVSSAEDAHIYIYYQTLDSRPDMVLAKVPNIKIHIEGARCNGYFDADKHTDADWQTMKRLSSQGFLKDEVLRMNSKWYCYSYHLSSVKESENGGKWYYNRKKYGLADILHKWDDICAMELDLIGADQFYDRFNGKIFVGSDKGLFATTYGIWMGKGLINYTDVAYGGLNYNGGNLWAIAHETGHHFQKLYDMQVCLESSNNLMSQIAVWRQGSNVSRGASMLEFVKKFNEGTNWAERTIGDRILPYWQLYLYYEMLGNHPDFYQDLCNRFRKSPMNNSDAKTDFLKFAMTCCDVVQEDLSEFFEFHGFFNKSQLGRVGLHWDFDFYDKTYGLRNININGADIDAARAYMKQYPRKRAANLLFIDERIRRVPAEHDGARATDMRLGSTPGVVPGDAKSVGEVGMYLDFGKDAVTAKVNDVKFEGRTISVKGEKIVGYKVYDASGNLIFVNTMNTFTLPEKIDIKGVKVIVASGNGDEITIIENGQLLDNFKLNPLGIEAVGTDNATTPIYDLSGRRTSNRSGLHVQDGKIKIAR